MNFASIYLGISASDETRSEIEQIISQANNKRFKCILIENKKEWNKLDLAIVEISNVDNQPVDLDSFVKNNSIKKDLPVLFLTRQPVQESTFNLPHDDRCFDIETLPLNASLFMNKIQLLAFRSRNPDFNAEEHNLLHDRRFAEEGIENKGREYGKRQSDEIYRLTKSLLETLPNPVFIKNINGEYINCNRAFEAFVNLDRSEIIGKTVFDIAEEDFANNIMKSDRKIFKTLKSEITENKFKNREGNIIDYRSHRSILRDENGNLNIVGTIMDVTEVKSAKKLLKIQHTIDYLTSLKKGLRHTFKIVFDLILDLDWIDGGGIYLLNEKRNKLQLVYHRNLSRNFIRLAKNYTVDTPQYQKIMSREKYFGSYKAFIHGSKTKVKEELFKGLAIIPLVDSESNTVIGCLNLASKKYNRISIHTIESIEAITKRLETLIIYSKTQDKIKELNLKLESLVKERTDALQESQKRFTELQENLPVGIFSATPEGNIEYINEAILKMLGYQQKSEIYNKRVVDFYAHQKDIYEVQSILNSKGHLNNHEIELKRADHSNFWAMISLNAITNPSGKAIKYEGIVKDETERKKAEAELRRKNKEIIHINKNLEQKIREALEEQQKNQNYLLNKSKLESLGELAAGIAHEINQPLGIMSLAFENLQTKINSGAATNEYIDTKINSIIGNIDRIRDIINHIRIFSRERDSIILQKINVNDVIHDVMKMVKTQYQNHNIHLVLDLDKNPGFTIGSKLKFEQVILNLLSNAKFAVEDNEFYQSETDYKKTIRLKTSVVNNKIKFEIEDNGIGINRENLDKIFDPFYTTKPEWIGTGLGLSITYGIVKEMHGEINVYSEEKKFTRFEILLPRFPENY